MARRDPSWVWRDVRWPLPLDVDTALELLDRLTASREPVPMVWEAYSRAGQIHYRVAAHPDHSTSVEELLREMVPGIRLLKSGKRPELSVAGRIAVTHPSLALNVDRVGATARAVLASLAGTRQAGDELVLQVVLGAHLPPAEPPERERGWLELLGATAPARSGGEDRSRRAVRTALHGSKTVIRLGAAAETPARAEGLLRSLLASLRVAEAAGVHLRFTTEDPRRLVAAHRPWRMPLHLSSRELVPLMGWPLGELPLPGIGSAHPKVLIPGHAPARDRTYATLPASTTPVGIGAPDSRLHTEILGPIGSGKSTVLLSLIMADIAAGRSVLVIDPKADLVADILARVPANRAKDVVVIDPTSPQPVGLNPLQDSTRQPELVADALLASFKSVFAETWGVRSEDVLGSALLTLARRRGSTLVELPALLSDPAYRSRILRDVDDPLGVEKFWGEYQQMAPAAQAALIAPTLNKLRAFLIRPGLRAVLGQSEPLFGLSELFTDRKIVLLSLNKGLVGPESARLLGSLVIGQLWPLILQRASLPPERRHLVSVFIDEVQDYLALPTDLADALSQARSLGVGFTLAHQYRAQLPPEMRAAIDANARNLIVFGLNQPDASEIAKMAPDLTAEDFMYLPRFHTYNRLMTQGHSTGWFSAVTTPPPSTLRDPVDLAAASATRYGRDAADIERGLRDTLAPSSGPVPTVDDESPIGRRKRP